MSSVKVVNPDMARLSMEPFEGLDPFAAGVCFWFVSSVEAVVNADMVRLCLEAFFGPGPFAAGVFVVSSVEMVANPDKAHLSVELIEGLNPLSSMAVVAVMLPRCLLFYHLSGVHENRRTHKCMQLYMCMRKKGYSPPASAVRQLCSPALCGQRQAWHNSIFYLPLLI